MSNPLALSPRATDVLGLVSQARSFLDQAVSIKDVKEFRDKAQALKSYVKQQGECLEIQNAAAEIKIRAERRAGELLADVGKRPGNPQFSHDERIRLPDLGIDHNQSARWQRVASIPEPAFDRHIAETKAASKELTTASVLRLAPSKSSADTKLQASVDQAVDKLVTVIVGILGRWPKKSVHILAYKLIDLGNELLRTGDIAA